MAQRRAGDSALWTAIASVEHNARWLSILSVSALTLVLCAWRLHCVTLGPDPDTDAYGHYMIARQLLETPENLRIHWVWLPLYHALLALGVWLGVSLDGVRSVNAVLAAVPPLLLFFGLARGRAGEARAPIFVAWLAAVLALGAPLAVQMGTTGQMEVWFSCLLLGIAVALRHERHALAAALLSLAVITRYEAWPVVAAVAATWALSRARGVRSNRAALAVIIAPSVVILTWAGLRAQQGEAWFGFILDNQAFAEGALQQTRADSRWFGVALLRYPVFLPALQFGAPAAFALLGVRRAVRQDGKWFLVVPLAVLAFLTASGLSRSQLGLDRHFLPLVPFVSAWIAHGVARAAEWLASAAGQARGAATEGGGAEKARLGRTQLALGAGLAVLVAVTHIERLRAPLAAWRATTRGALIAERSAAEFIASTPRESLIVCDEASIEVLSGLPSERFARVRVGLEAVVPIRALAEQRQVFVVSRAQRIAAAAGLGPRVYVAPSGEYAALRVVSGVVSARAARD